MFEWECCDDGYEWCGSALVPSSTLRTRYAPPISGKRPQDETWRDVFLIFSTTKPTRVGIEKFAILYGLLGVLTVAVRRRAYAPQLARAFGIRRPRTIQQQGEPITAWFAEIRDMKRAIQLHSNRNLTEFWRLVNTKLRDTVALCLTPNGGRDPVPKNLLGFMWLQLGLKSQGPWEFRECPVCRGPMAVRDMGRRPSRLTDRESCRVTLSKLRRDYREGSKSLNDIARRLRTDLKTARRWMKKT